MITYRNDTYSTKTFYGVTFLPKETKSVPGYINANGMVRVNSISIDKQDITDVKPKRQYNRKPQESKSVDTETESINETEQITKEESN